MRLNQADVHNALLSLRRDARDPFPRRPSRPPPSRRRSGDDRLTPKRWPAAEGALRHAEDPGPLHLTTSPTSGPGVSTRRWDTPRSRNSTSAGGRKIRRCRWPRPSSRNSETRGKPVRARLACSRHRRVRPRCCPARP